MWLYLNKINEIHGYFGIKTNSSTCIVGSCACSAWSLMDYRTQFIISVFLVGYNVKNVGVTATIYNSPWNKRNDRKVALHLDDISVHCHTLLNGYSNRILTQARHACLALWFLSEWMKLWILQEWYFSHLFRVIHHWGGKWDFYIH